MLDTQLKPIYKSLRLLSSYSYLRTKDGEQSYLILDHIPDIAYINLEILSSIKEESLQGLLNAQNPKLT